MTKTVVLVLNKNQEEAQGNLVDCYKLSPFYLKRMKDKFYRNQFEFGNRKLIITEIEQQKVK